MGSYFCCPFGRFHGFCIDTVFYTAFLLSSRTTTQDAGRMQQLAELKKKREIK